MAGSGSSHTRGIRRRSHCQRSAHPPRLSRKPKCFSAAAGRVGVHRQAFPLPPSNVEFDKSLLAPPKTTLTQLSNGVKAILLLRTSAQTCEFRRLISAAFR